MTLREMIARRSAIRAEMTGLHEATPSGDLPTEARSKWDALETELRSLDGSMDRQARLDELDRRTPGAPLDGDHRFDELRAGIGILDVVRAQMDPSTREAGRVREVSAELERRSGRKAEGIMWDMRPAPRAMEQRTTTSGRDGTGTNGAALVPTLLDSANFIDRLRSRLVVRRLGARILSDLSGNVDLPRRAGSVQASWVGENQAIPLSDAAFDKVQLRPHHAGALTELSRNMIMQSSPDVEQITQDDMALTLAELLDNTALIADGTSNTPTGILPQITTKNTYSGDAPAWSDVLNLLTTLDAFNVTPSAWAESPTMRGLLLGTPKHATQSNGYIQEDPNNLLGLPVLSSPFVPGLLVGDWSDVIIGFWSELDILVNPYALGSYEKGNVQVRAMLTCDVAVRHPQSFALLYPAQK